MSFNKKALKTVFAFSLCVIVSGCASSISGSSVTSCKSSAPLSTTETDNVTNWKINKDLTAAQLPEYANHAFRQCYPEEGTFQPLVLFGTQSASETNDIILCYWSGTPSDSLDVVTIAHDNDGNCRVISVVPFDLAEVTENTDEEKNRSTFEINEDVSAQVIPEEVLDALADVSNHNDNSSGTNHRIAGNTVRTVAYLGKESSFGTNYAVLCIIHAKDKNPYWAAVTIHVNEEARGEYSAISPIDPENYISYADNGEPS